MEKWPLPHGVRAGEVSACSLGLILQRSPCGAAVTPVILAVLISLQASLSLLGVYPAVDGLGYLGTLQYSKHVTLQEHRSWHGL